MRRRIKCTNVFALYKIDRFNCKPIYSVLLKRTTILIQSIAGNVNCIFLCNIYMCKLVTKTMPVLIAIATHIITNFGFDARTNRMENFTKLAMKLYHIAYFAKSNANNADCKGA